MSDTPEEKAKLMFKIYDVNEKGTLSKDEFKAMLK
jgi:Ca2+-binding EF-hand superfamily protein